MTSTMSPPSIMQMLFFTSSDYTSVLDASTKVQTNKKIYAQVNDFNSKVTFKKCKEPTVFQQSALCTHSWIFLPRFLFVFPIFSFLFLPFSFKDVIHVTAILKILIKWVCIINYMVSNWLRESALLTFLCKQRTWPIISSVCNIFYCIFYCFSLAVPNFTLI